MRNLTQGVTAGLGARVSELNKQEETFTVSVAASDFFFLSLYVYILQCLLIFLTQLNSEVN